MTKKEKKETIKRLIGDLYKNTDIDKIVEIREKIVKEIYSSGFNENQLKTISLAVDTFGSDIDNNLILKLENKNNIDADDFTRLSISGILAVIDLSQLDD
ncbi:MAG: hypothetical protein NTZ59_15615 [Bacteroidetes bacterium]|nr:hypothetical protein [Bacteroidota bacterium]